jgi:hypothetical protein
VQVVVTGGVPPVATGAAKTTATALPSSAEGTVWGAGQAIVSAPGVGLVGLSPQAAATTAINAAAQACQQMREAGFI